MTDKSTSRSLLTRTDGWFAVAIWLGALALYIRTLAPSLLWGDSAEFQVLSYTLGMTHPSGYMTHIMIGKLFTLLPVGNIAYRANLMSAFFGALAVTQVYLIVRLHGGWRVAGVAAACLLAFTEGFWWRAIIAESYAIAASMLASVWLLTLLWERTRNWRFLFVAGLLGGLSVGIHSTIVMTAAAVLIVMALKARTRADWIGAAAGALVGSALTLGAFLFVDANDPPSSIYNTVYRPSLSAMGITASQFSTPFGRLFAIFPANHFWSYYFTAAPAEIHARLVEYAGSFPWWVLTLIVVGLVALLARRTWTDGAYPLVAFLLVWGFAVTVSFSIFREFYVPVGVIVHVWFGAGASAALEGLDRLIKRWQAEGSRMRNVALGVVSLALVVFPFWQARADLSLAVQKGYTTFVRREHIYPVFAPDKAISDATKILNRVEDNAIVISDWDKLYTLVYTAYIDQKRTGISLHEATITDVPRLADSMLAYIDANLDQRPIYFTVLLPELKERYQVQQIADNLFRIRRKE